jgi:hypothetical protein
VLSEGGASVERVEDTFLGDEKYHLRSTLEFWWYLLGRQPSGRAFVNPGPGILVFAVLALLALPSLRTEPRRLAVALFLVVVALVLLSGLSSGNMELFRRTIKVSSSGRYLTPAFAALAVVAARCSRDSAALLWGVAVLAGLWLARPMRFAPAEPKATALVALAVVAAGAVAGLAGLAARRGRLPPLAAVGLALVATSAGTAAIGRVRQEHRYEIWQAAADPRYRTFHMHSLNPVYASAWVLWRALDDPEGHRLAVLAGWDGVGHNWYQYPLLGSRLQNRVVYVPPTRDGVVVDYRSMAEVAQRASFVAWLEGLLERNVDHVVSLAPRNTVEDYWMRQAPGVFAPEAGDPAGYHVAYRLDRAAAEAALREIAARTSAAR